MIKNIIFDLDGTIADSAELMMSLVESLCKKNGYKTFGSKGLKKIRSLGTGKFISQIGIRKEDVSVFVDEMSSELIKKYNQVQPVSGIVKLVKELAYKKYFLAIVTTNKKDNALNFVNKFGINISLIYDQAGLSGKSKLLGQLVTDYNLNTDETVYIGDEDRDILSAKESGLKSMGVTWGLTSKEVLLSLKPDFVISNPQELLDVLKK